MNRDNDMQHVKSAAAMREEIAAGKPLRGVYGDTRGGATFTQKEFDSMNFYDVYAGPGTTKWTIAEVDAAVEHIAAEEITNA